MMPISSDAESIDTDALIADAKAGDLNAFEQLYRAHVGLVYSLSYRMVANSARAEELTQEAFVRVWQKLNLFDGQSAFSTWLYRLATNVVLSDLRKKQLVDTKEDFDQMVAEQAHIESHPGEGRDLEAGILQLPDKARQVFVLHDVEGFKHKEIADMLGIAEGTSKTQLHRARKLLREWIQ